MIRRRPLMAPTMLKPLNILFVLTLFLLLGGPLSGLAAASPPQITMVFRYDDYSSRSATGLEKQIIAAFKQCQVCCTFSIIPFVKAVNYLDVCPQALIPLTAAKAEMARQAMAAGAMDAAQHGYSHQRGSYARNWCTEFEGLDYDSQLHKIEQGKIFLEKVLETKITTFVPPFNSYDANTITVLEKLNFHCLSASLRGQIVPTTSLKILPETCTLAQLSEVIRHARKNAGYHPLICVMFHQYDFVGCDCELEAEKSHYKTTPKEFYQLLSWITAQKDLKVRSISQILQENIDLSMNRFINNRFYLELVHLKPAWWPPHYGFYLPADTAYNIRAKNIFLNITIPRLKNLFYVGSFYLIILISVFISSYLLSLVVFSISGILDKIFKFISLILACSLILYMIFTPHIEYKKMEIITGALGASLAVWLFCLKRKKSGAGRAGD